MLDCMSVPIAGVAVSILETSFADIAIRSYDATLAPDRHGHAQLVLPLAGEVHIEIETTRSRLDPFHGAVVIAGAWHAQRSIADNRSLILDVDQAILTDARWAGLLDRPFQEISLAARKLVEFMHLCIEGGTVRPALIQGWIPLLLDTLASGSPQVRSRLAALLAYIESHLALPWSTDSMARYANISVSRLHALFREELDTSPRAWLLHKRLELACALLTQTNQTIAAVALSTGFSDQSTLTRAMRQQIDTTPAAYRTWQQETRPK